MKYKIAIVILYLICYWQETLAKETVWPECPIILQTFFVSSSDCRRNDELPELEGLHITYTNSTNNEITKNFWNPNIGANYIDDFKMFNEDGRINSQKFRIKTSVSHFSGDNANEDYFITRIGKNEKYYFSDAAKCGTLKIHKDRYELTIYAYVDLPPHLDEISDGEYYSLEKPLKLKLNDFYVNENTQCTLQYKYGNNSSFKDLTDYHGTIAPNEIISICYSDIKKNEPNYKYGDKITLCIKKTTQIGNLKIYTSSNPINVIFWNSIPNFSYLIFKKSPQTINFYLPKIEKYQYNAAAGGENVLDGNTEHKEKDGLFIYENINISQLNSFTLQINGSKTDVFHYSKTIIVNDLKTIVPASVIEPISPNNYDYSLTDDNGNYNPHVFLKFTDQGFHVPYSIVKLSNGEPVGNEITTGVKELSTNNEKFDNNNIVSQIYCLQEETKWLDIVKGTQSDYQGSEKVQESTCEQLGKDYSVFSHIEDNADGKKTAYIFVFSNATCIPGCNSPQYSVIEINDFPSNYDVSKITKHNSYKAQNNNGSTEYACSCYNVSIRTDGGMLYFTSRWNEEYQSYNNGNNDYTKELYIYLNTREIDSYSYITGNGNKLIVQGELNPIDNKYKYYLMDMIGKSKEYLLGFECGILDSNKNCAYYDGHSINYQDKSVLVNSGELSSIVYAGFDSVNGLYYVIYKLKDNKYPNRKYRQYMVDANTTAPLTLKTEWINTNKANNIDKYYNPDNEKGYKLTGITTNRKETYRLTDALGLQSTFDVSVKAPFFDKDSTSVTGIQIGEDTFKYEVTAKYIDMGSIKYNGVKIDESNIDTSNKDFVFVGTNKKTEIEWGQTFTIKELKSDNGILCFKRTPSITDSNEIDSTLTYGVSNHKTPSATYTYCDNNSAGEQKGKGTIIVYFDANTTTSVVLKCGTNEIQPNSITNGTAIFSGLNANVEYKPIIRGSINYEMLPITITDSNTFAFNSDTITNATTIAGTGSAIFTVKNAIQNTTWTLDGIKNENAACTCTYNSKLSITGLSAKQYIVTATQSGCTISKTFDIKAPVVTGRVKVEQVNNEIAVTAKIDSVNELVEDLKIELCNNKSNDTLNIKYKPNQQNIIDTIAWAITNDKNGKNTIKLKYNGDNYWEVCTFTIADDTLSDLSLAYTIDTTVPKCFEQDLKFDLNPVESPKKKNFQSNINGKNEGKNFVVSGDSYSIANSSINEKSIVAFKVKNDSSATNNVVNGTSFTINYFRSRNDTIKDLYDNFHIDSLSAKVLYDDFLCSYSENTDLKIDTIKGGFGYGEEIYYKYKWIQKDSLIRDTTETRNKIGNRTENIIQCTDSGRYTIFIRDEGNHCKARNLGTYHIKRPSPITIENIPTDPICELTANGTIQVTAEGGLVNNLGYRYYIDTVYIADGNIHYDWTERYDNYGKLLNWNERENRIKRTTDSITYKPEIVKSSQTVTFNSLYPGIYKTIVLDSNNCVQARTDTLRQYHNPYVTAAHYDSVRCYGEKNGHIVIDKVTGSYPVTSFQLYKYNNDSVYVRDTNGIIVNSLAKNISTKITSDDRIWEYNADSAFVLIDSLYAGNYWIALTDTNKCSTPVVKRDLPFGEKSGKHFNIPVRQPDSLILSINDENNIIREYGKPGGSVNVNVSGGNKGTFNIYLDSKEDSLTQVIWGNHAFNDIFTPGTHKLYVTDHKECIDSATTKQMRQPDSPLSIEATPHDALCNGSFGSITVRGSGGWNGYQYSCSSKSNLYGANQNEYTFYDIKGGYYEVSVTDAEGVTATQKVYVNTPPKLMAVPQLRASSCKNDGLISANITGGTMPYLVKPDSSSVTPFYFEPYITNSNLTIIPKQLAAGDYSIVVVDSNNCEILMSATIADSSVKATVKPVYPTAHEFANGRLEAVVQQGPAPYTYQWKNHNTGETCTNAVWDKVGAGVYSLDVTDANNCSVSVPITYLATNGDLPLIIDTIIGETAVGACNGMAKFTSDTTGFKSITLHGNSGVEKDVTSMVNNKLHFELTGLAPDSYLLECVLADTTVRYAKFTIARYEPMHLIVSNIVDVSKQDAANGSAKLRIDGGRAPFIVQMLRGDDFLADTVLNDRNLPMSGLTAANYTVSVVDESDNRINTQFIIRKPEKPLRLQAQSVENPSCNGYTNGRIILKATGGWGDYEYAAAEGEFGRATAYDGRGAAVHTFVAIDSKGTTDTLKVELVEPLPLTARVVQVDSVSCFGRTDGSVTFDIAGGTAPYTVHYDDFFDKKSNFVGSLNAGTHTFNITDSNFCRAVEGSLAVDIPQPGVLQVASDSVVHTTCNTDNGRIFITIAGGTAPYANSWREDGLIKERFANLTAIDSLQGYSLYEVEVFDAKGCKAGKSYRINPSSGPKIERVRTLPVLCHGDSTGTAIIDSADIVPATPYSPFRIEWPHGENAMSVGNLPAGWNVVFVIDSNNCKSGTGFNVDAPSPVGIRKIGSRDASCYGYADGRISTLTLGGVGGYRYLWSNGDTLPDIDSIAKGAYTIVVADRNNCRDSAVFAIGQPDSLHVEIGEENVLMCPDNTYEFIPTDGFKTYRWILNDSTLSDKRNLIASEQGEYHLVATYGANCISRDTVTITIGDDLLEADFYMASDASKDNTIALVELSNMKTDSIRWDFSATDFEVMDSSLYELQLKPNTIGRHNITLWAYSSGCVSYITKQVEISELPDTTDNIQLGYDPLIKSVTVKPNPTNGQFGVDVQLRESHEAEMTISSVSHGTQIEQRKLAGDAEYSESFDLSNASDGVYILRIAAGNEQRLAKVLITK